jgi:hypothetical protein
VAWLFGFNVRICAPPFFFPNITQVLTSSFGALNQYTVSGLAAIGQGMLEYAFDLLTPVMYEDRRIKPYHCPIGNITLNEVGIYEIARPNSLGGEDSSSSPFGELYDVEYLHGTAFRPQLQAWAEPPKLQLLHEYGLLVQELQGFFHERIQLNGTAP